MRDRITPEQKNAYLSRAGIAAVLAVAAAAAGGEVYRVGPGEPHAGVSQVADILQPGDIVEVTGDIEDHFTLTAHGRHDQPIVIRGVARLEAGRPVRPKIILDNTAGFGIVCRGDWNVLDGLDISGTTGDSFASGVAIAHQCDNLTILNCYIHHNRQAVFSVAGAGNVVIEFCEFDSNGGYLAPSTLHTLYLSSNSPMATATVQFCYIHDALGGHMLKSRFPRNVVRYNWFENAFFSCVQIIDVLDIGPVKVGKSSDALYPMHSDVVGNVFFQGWSPGARYCVLQLGGEDKTAPGTEGDFHVAHNLFLTSRSDGEIHGVAMLVHGNVDRVRAYNNIFLEYGVSGSTVYERGSVWETPRTESFRQRRGHGEPLVEGANNWISRKALAAPERFKDTLRGVNPFFVDLTAFDFRPRKDSPLCGAGLWPLPKGQIIDLVPEYEPQRAIPSDLKPTPRRKATPPSIGPFEVEH